MPPGNCNKLLIREVIMSTRSHLKLSGYLTVSVGLVFFAIAIIGEQPAYLALGGAFVVIGASTCGKAQSKQE